CRKFTAKEPWRCSMLGGRFEGIDNADARSRLERRNETVQQGIRFCDLVIHVHQDRNVGRFGCQSWIVWLASSYRDILQAKSAHSFAQGLQIFGYDVFGDALDVVAAASAYVRDGHSGFDAEQSH